MEIPNVNENEIIEMIVKCDKKEFKLKVVNVNSLSDDLRSNIMKNYNYKGKIVLFRNEIFAQNAIELYRKILELPDDENWSKASRYK
jgi:hypothetical protein